MVKDKDAENDSGEEVEEVERDGGGSDGEEGGEETEPTVLSVPVTRRVLYLRKLQEDRNALEEQYRDERVALEKKYKALYAPLYEKRSDIVCGRTDVPEDSGVEDMPPAETAEPGSEQEVGIPGFWVRALATNDVVSEIIEENDIEVLNFLSDVRCVDHEDMTGFTLEFHFKPNDFFTDAVLTKRYDVPNLLHGDEPMLEDVKGTEIQWKAGKNLTVRTVKKKQRQKGGSATRMVTKREPCDSFFNFFKPQELPTGEEDMDEDEEEKMVERIDQDFVRAMVIRDRIIPFGVLWFTGEATEGADNESGEGEDEDEDEEGEEGEGDDSKEEGDDSADKDSDEGGPAATQEPSAPAGQNPEECKQQ